MSGAHRRTAGNPVNSSLKSARWLLMLVAVPALLALIVYLLIFEATDPEIWGATWLIWVGMFIRAIVRRRQDRAFPWIAAGLVLTTTWQFARAWAQEHGWPADQLHAVALIGDGTQLIAFASAGVGVVILIKSSRLNWRRGPFAQK